MKSTTGTILLASGLFVFAVVGGYFLFKPADSVRGVEDQLAFIEDDAASDADSGNDDSDDSELAEANDADDSETEGTDVSDAGDADAGSADDAEAKGASGQPASVPAKKPSSSSSTTTTTAGTVGRNNDPVPIPRPPAVPSSSTVPGSSSTTSTVPTETAGPSTAPATTASAGACSVEELEQFSNALDANGDVDLLAVLSLIELAEKCFVEPYQEELDALGYSDDPVCAVGQLGDLDPEDIGISGVSPEEVKQLLALFAEFKALDQGIPASDCS